MGVAVSRLMLLAAMIIAMEVAAYAIGKFQVTFLASRFIVFCGRAVKAQIIRVVILWPDLFRLWVTKNAGGGRTAIIHMANVADRLEWLIGDGGQFLEHLRIVFPGPAEWVAGQTADACIL